MFLPLWEFWALPFLPLLFLLYNIKKEVVRNVDWVKMLKNKLRANPLGEQTAENDKNLLISSFIETPEYRSLLESRDSTVVVGRRGTGKSAMYLKLAEVWGGAKKVIT